MACPQPTYWDYYKVGDQAGQYKVGNLEVKDPLQGKYLKNCSLIAVLASLAWKNQIPTLAEPYTFPFYGNINTPTQKTNGTLPLDANRQLLHAKSDTSPLEIWPALWEKAYYQWLDNLPKVTDHPNYALHTEWQSPVTLLYHLTGKTVSQKSCPDANTVFNDIDAFCNNCGRSSTNRAIRTPAVAWTHASGSGYSDTTIAAQHTYSLLGVVKSGTELTKKYIVLRNPKGTVNGDPLISKTYLYTAAPWCNEIGLGVSDGIFALRIDQFVNYFAGYAWTTV